MGFPAISTHQTWDVAGIRNRKRSTTLKLHGFGTVPVIGEVEGKQLNGVQQKVRYVPNLGVNLFSIISANRNGHSVTFSGENGKIFKGDKVLAVGSAETNNLYLLDVFTCHSKFSSCLPPKATRKPLESIPALAK